MGERWEGGEELNKGGPTATATPTTSSRVLWWGGEKGLCRGDTTTASTTTTASRGSNEGD